MKFGLTWYSSSRCNNLSAPVQYSRNLQIRLLAHRRHGAVLETVDESGFSSLVSASAETDKLLFWTRHAIIDAWGPEKIRLREGFTPLKKKVKATR